MRYLPLLLIILTTTSLNYVVAQVSGTKTVPGDYPTIAAAVNAINSVGISGNVNIYVAGNHTETAPTGGIVLKFQSGVYFLRLIR